MSADPANIALFFDTETTGLPVPHLPPSSPAQPKLVQLAFILADVGGQERASCSMMIRPENWTIPKAASDVHGITTETAMKYGIPLRTAISVFSHHLVQAGLLIAHNIKFDLAILEGALWQIGRGDAAANLHKFPRFCTQEASRDIVRCPPTDRMRQVGRDHFKPPKLSEAYSFFRKKELEGAHDALVDVRACREVYESIRGWSGTEGAGDFVADAP
jgi:DNA polymerase-3 subunit epsilon